MLVSRHVNGGSILLTEPLAKLRIMVDITALDVRDSMWATIQSLLMKPENVIHAPVAVSGTSVDRGLFSALFEAIPNRVEEEARPETQIAHSSATC